MNDNKDFLEKTLEDILFEASNLELEARGLNIGGIKKRQVKIGNYGIADLITCERIKSDCYSYRLDFTIYELKKGSIDEHTFFQALRYARGLKSFLDQYKSIDLYKIDIVLIGSKINHNDSSCYLPDLLNYTDDCGSLSVKLYTYKYKFDGISFIDVSGYKLIDEGF